MNLICCFGKTIALSFMHGGPGPYFFSSVVVDYLFGGISSVTPGIEDIIDQRIQERMYKVIIIRK